jgi:hypothetical protein
MSDASKTGSNANQPYMTEAVIPGGDKAASDQNTIDKGMYDENGDPLFTDDYNLAQEHRDREGKGEGRVPDTDLEYQQGGDTSDETGDPMSSEAGVRDVTSSSSASEQSNSHGTHDESQPLDERLSGNSR